MLVAAALLIGMHEETGLSIRQLRALMGDYREHTEPSAKHPQLPQLKYLAGVRSVRARRSLMPGPARLVA